MDRNNLEILLQYSGFFSNGQLFGRGSTTLEKGITELQARTETLRFLRQNLPYADRFVVGIGNSENYLKANLPVSDLDQTLQYCKEILVPVFSFPAEHQPQRVHVFSPYQREVESWLNSQGKTHILESRPGYSWLDKVVLTLASPDACYGYVTDLPKQK